jgi:hypothetical protein
VGKFEPFGRHYQPAERKKNPVQVGSQHTRRNLVVIRNYFFLFCLFDDAISHTNYTLSNGKISSEEEIKVWKEMFVA